MSRRWRRVPILLLFAGLMIAAGFLGPRLLAYWALGRATRDLEVWAVSDALWWLDRAQRLSGPSADQELIRARAYRSLGWSQRSERALARAEKLGAAQGQLENERLLERITSGQLYQGAEDYLPRFTSAGVPPNDIASALIFGCLAHQQLDRARAMLEAWETDMPEQAHTFYMWGRYWLQINDLDRAAAAFQRATRLNPRHEIAQLAEVETIYRKGDDLTGALTGFLSLAERYRTNDDVLVGLARVLRELARPRQAAKALEVPASRERPLSSVALEMGQITLELGNYDEAYEWLRQANARDMSGGPGIMAAGITLALAGHSSAAHRVFQRAIRSAATIRRMQEVQNTMVLDPTDRAAADEYRRILADLSENFADRNPLLSEPLERSSGDPDAEPGSASEMGAELYVSLCSQCHGETGDGRGRSARHVYPRPRDLRNSRMRLVSTQRGLPSLRDVKRVIRDGIPGTSMAAHHELDDGQLQRLALRVLDFRRQGVRVNVVSRFQFAGEELNEAEIDEIVDNLTNAGPSVELPVIGPSVGDSDSRGHEVFVEQACPSCHGTDGRGDPTMALYDDDGAPVSPTDLVADPFKGGEQGTAVYLRILLGMPGSPHPANVLADPALIDLVHYCSSIRGIAGPARTNHERAIRAYSRSIF